MPENIAIRVALLTGAFLLPGAAAMWWLSESRFFRYLRRTHNALWLELGPHPSSGRNNTSAYFQFLSHHTPGDIPDAELWRLANRVSRWLFIFLGAIVVLVLSALLAGCVGSNSDGETLGSKSEWSVLQGVEYDTRSAVITTPVQRTIGQYKLLGVPSNDGQGIIWVMLNPQHPPLYKQMPDGGYRISRVQLDSLVREKSAIPVVQEALALHVAD